MNNSPVYDDRGQRVWLQDSWRIPAWPFWSPTCHNQRARRIGWNKYRCPACAAKLQPERLYHRLMLWWNPFRRPDERPIRRLVRVTRWRPGKDTGDTA